MSNRVGTGRCLCGAVTFEIDAAPMMSAACHCTHCQRQTGTLFSVIVGVPENSLRVTGRTSVFRDVGDSGQVLERRFCGGCGSPLYSVAAAAPGLVFVKAGALDNWRDYPPVLELYRDRSAPWVPFFDGARAFPGAAPGGEPPG